MPRDNITPLHRGVAPIDERRIARIMGDPDAILRRLDGVPYHVEIQPVPSLFERICGWLGDTFGESPRGFAFFAATLAPLAVAAFLVGYFGLRELLAVFS